jgi:hypothetical protein
MTEPLTPAECDLQDFPFMPLHVARLRDSDLAATVDPEAAWYAVMLWAASWHQIPAASLPNDDQVLTRLCGLGRDVKTFRKNRTGAMHGFVLCDDDRWYHPVVAEQANAAWKAKQEQRWRTECARIKKHNQRHETDVSAPSLEEFIASGCQPVPLTAPSKSPTCPQGHGGEVPRENPSKGEGQREGEGQGESIIEVEEERTGAKPDSVEETARLVGNAAGINHNPANDPQRYADNLAHVREWVKLGATVEEMTDCAQRACAAQSEPIRTFRYLDAAIRQTVARREIPNGTRQSPARSSPRSSASGRLLAAIAAEEAERPH